MKRNLIFLGLMAPFVVNAQNNLKLLYTEPAAYWEASLPLGNGRLGAMPDGGIFKENIVLNDITLWSGGPQDADKKDAYKSLPEIRKLLLASKNIEAQQLMSKTFVCSGQGSGNGNGANVPYGSYQILANLTIAYNYGTGRVKAQPAAYHRELSLNNATAQTAFRLGGVTYKRTCFSSFGNDVIVMHLTANKLKKISFELGLNRPEHAETSLTGQELDIYGQLNNGTNGKGMKYIGRVQVKHTGGTLVMLNNSLRLKGANSATIYISAGTDYGNDDYLRSTSEKLTAALKTPFEQEEKTHVKNFQRRFNRAGLNIGGNNNDMLPTDKRLANYQNGKTDNGLPALYFQYGRYLLISSTRPGLLPPNLQGLWANTIETPWNGDYHLDINIQMNHWPLDVTNLGMLNEPFFKLVDGLVKPGEQTARAYYNSPGWVAFVITNIWGYTSPGEDYSWGAFNTGSAWLCQMLWSHYQFSQDTAYLRGLYPLLKGSSMFYLHTLVKEPEHGWLVTAPSNSPENAFLMPDGNRANVTIGPAIDNQLIRSLFSATITAGNLLKTDNHFTDSLKKAIAQLPPNQVSADGRLMEWINDYKETELHHRHVSHLWGLYPGDEISLKTPYLAAAAEKSLQVRGDEGTGWSLAWKMNLWARLHNGGHSLLLFHKLLRPVTTNKVNMSNGGGSYISLLCGHPPFQIDGNFGGSAAIAEMLLQSDDGAIELLPALPTEWADGSFHGLCARGGAEVSASWKNSLLTTLTIKATATNRFRLKKPDGIRNAYVVKNKKKILVTFTDGFATLQLKKGSSIRFTFS